MEDPETEGKKIRRISRLIERLSAPRIHGNPWVYLVATRCADCHTQNFYSFLLTILSYSKEIEAAPPARDDLFEIIDGVCFTCHSDWLQHALAKHEPHRSEFLALGAPRLQLGQRCPGCKLNQFRLLKRGKKRVCGFCPLCAQILLPAWMQQRREEEIQDLQRQRDRSLQRLDTICEPC